MSAQAQILNLLEHLKNQFGLTMMFISHDLAVVKNIIDRVMVMYLGKVCEVVDSDRLYAVPAHPYSRALLASIPGHSLDVPPASVLISGELPSPLDPPSGCRFRTRCPDGHRALLGGRAGVGGRRGRPLRGLPPSCRAPRQVTAEQDQTRERPDRWCSRTSLVNLKLSQT